MRIEAHVLLLGVLLLAVSSSQADWDLRVHQGDAVTGFRIETIDSLTVDEVPDTPDGMVWIPAGNVRLGQIGVAAPVHDFWVDGFWIGKYEVTNAEYKEFIDAGGYGSSEWWDPVGWDWRVDNGITLPRHWDTNEYHGGGISGNELFPVLGVSWWEADAYCRWAGGRLPTEAEWEKAAKGGCEMWGDPLLCDASSNPTFPWGEGINGQRANYDNSGDPFENNGWTTPVGYFDGSLYEGWFQTIDSPSPYGLYDVAGNVFEWTSSRSLGYPYLPDDGREDPPTTWNECCRVLRGGSWLVPTSYSRCAYRHGIHDPSHYSHNTGFRIARSR